jgi:SAM-dependent methyltransferase
MWDERYSAPGFAYGTAPNDFLVEVAGRIPAGGRVLCLAEGEGRNAVYLAERGHDVVAVDMSPVGLEKARGLAAARGVVIDTVVANLKDFVIDEGAWDAIVSIWAHVPPALRAPLHAACVKGLKPGGVFILEAYAPSQVARGTGGPRDPALCMSANQLREELAGLHIERLEEKTRFVHEGEHHHGDSDVVQALLIRR